MVLPEINTAIFIIKRLQTEKTGFLCERPVTSHLFDCFGRVLAWKYNFRNIAVLFQKRSKIMTAHFVLSLYLFYCIMSTFIKRQNLQTKRG